MRNSFKQGVLMLAFCSLATFLVIPSLTAQNAVHIKGRVVGENGQPIPKATVQVNKSKTAVTTDDNGNYEITAASDATLVISSVGYSPFTVRVEGRSFLDAVLHASPNSLDQVVVVGYGTQKKRDVTGSIVSVSAKTLSEVPAPNMGLALQGRAAGVEIQRVGTQPGANTVIRVRGERSILGSNDPLLVLDGIPYEGTGLNDINPDDIASIEVLKDASATAIYGSRGANGVVLISTKKGKAGVARIDYSGYGGINSVSKKYPMFNPQEYTAMRIAANTGYLNEAFETANLAKGVNTDWQKLMYQNGYTTDHNLTVSGGTTEGSTYSLGGGYYKETAVLPGINFTRYSLRGTIDTKVGKHLKVGLNTLNSYTETNGTQFLNTGLMFNMLAASPLYTPDSGGIVVLSPYGNSDDRGTTYSPILLKHNNNNWIDLIKRFRSFNTLYAEYQIIPELKYRVNVGLNYRREEDDQFKGADMKPANPSFFRPNQGNTASVNNQEGYGYTLEHILSFDKELRGGHRINVTGLYSVQKDIAHSTYASKDSINADFIQFYNLGLSNPSNNVKPVLNGSEATWGLESYMARINYSYKDRYLLTLTGRIDGSSRLAEGHKYHHYPALSAGWHISQEQFMQPVTFINDLKLRVGYGETSNQAINPYASLGNVTPSNNLTTTPGATGSVIHYNYGAATIVTGYNLQSLPNSNLDWEYTRTVNIGIDATVLRNRITFTGDYYDAHTRNVLYGLVLPITSGVTGQYVSNIGEMSNKGFEFSFSTVNISNPNGFNWSTDLNIFWNRNKLVKLYNGFKQDLANQLFVGQPLTAIYDLKKTGIWQTADSAAAAVYGAKPGYIRFADLNKDNKIDLNNDRQVLGSGQATWQGGITNRFSYKGFDLSFVIYARMGGLLVSQVYQPYAAYLAILNGRRNNVKVDYWTPTNPTNKFPSPAGMLNSNLGLTTLGYYDASFIKMRSINVGYSFNAKLLSSIKAQSIRVYVTAQNPFVLYSPYMREGGVDPEATSIGNTGVQDPGNLSKTRALTIGVMTPPTRAFLFGVNVRF